MSIDGGSSYIIDNYSDHAFQTTDATVTLDGNYDLVLDYYEGGASNRVSFEIVSVVLPVELTAFSAYKAEEGVVLSWNTASEINNDYFDIERSIDGQQFEQVGRVAGHGTTALPQSYRWVDLSSLSGITYYRLKQVDFDGDFAYSPLVFVDQYAQPQYRIYPNPSKGVFTLDVGNPLEEDELSYQVSDLSGKVVDTGQLPVVSNRVRLDLKDLERGTYYLMLKEGSRLVRKRLIIE